MSNSFFRSALLVAAGLMLSALANAQSADHRKLGIEGGVDIIYQDATTLNFDGGTRANLATDYGVSFTAGYRVNPHFDAQLALDVTDVDYRVAIVTGTGSTVQANGSYRAYTPRTNIQLNLIDGPFTPFLVGGVGYSLVDTNIPNGRPQSGCYWDPWYGYICGTVQSTKWIDGFVYQVGVGARLDVSNSASVHLAVERHWIDFHSNGSPYVDQFKAGFSWRF
jgi:opacity protein-like surface antigen